MLGTSNDVVIPTLSRMLHSIRNFSGLSVRNSAVLVNGHRYVNKVRSFLSLKVYWVALISVSLAETRH